MIRLSQKNPLWSPIRLGNSRVTVGSHGCTITCVSMFSDWYKCYKSPGKLARELSFTSTGLLIWSSIAKVLCCQFKWRFYSFNKPLIAEVLKSKDDVCLLNVDRGYHWVAALYAVPFIGYMCADPWTGKNRLYRYAEVVGGSILTRK